MSRKITTGTYIENAKTVNINKSIGVAEGKQEMPETISGEQWVEFIRFIEVFLESNEAGALTVSNHNKIQEELSIAKLTDAKSGWQRFREFLGDSANVVTVLTPIATFVAANSNQIAQWIQSIF